eukprot:4933829-Prorocentrum_lima.AAC.1
MSEEVQLSPTDSEWPVLAEQHSEHVWVARMVEPGVLENLVVELEMVPGLPRVLDVLHPDPDS